MGRITIFTSDDLNSKQVTQALNRRGLPYVEISTVDDPSRMMDVKALAQTYSVPRVFFNTRHVGGVEETMAELKLWDADPNYNMAALKYKAEIAAFPDPENPRLALPKTAGVEVLGVPEPLANVKLPDGTMTSIHDITEKLKNTLPRSEIRQGATIYKDAFTGRTAVKAFTESMDVSKSEALAFGTDLIEAKVLRPISTSKSSSTSKDCKDSDSVLYRLQCHAKPDVLNSYCVWTCAPTDKPFELIARLDSLLNQAELESVNKEGKIDYRKVIINKSYNMFEQAVCELQKIDPTISSGKGQMAFALNIYKIMLRYSFAKIGIPVNEADRLHFLRSVKFNIGGSVFTLADWYDGVLRANKPATRSGRLAFNTMDKRKKFALSKLDVRIHFAAHLDAVFGSKVSMPFRTFAADQIDEQLDLAASVFCSDDANVSVNRKTNDIKLGRLYAAYRGDFAKRESELVAQQVEYLDGPKKSEIEALLKSDKVKVRYMEFQWTQNATEYSSYSRDTLVNEVTTLTAILRRFKPPKTPVNEQMRLATLYSLNLLDTLPEERFDRITRMVRDEFQVPLVFVSLVDANRQWFKSQQWECSATQVSETGRDISFCGHAIRKSEDELFVVEDALQDDRFADNPLVTGDLAVRFYAGAPLSISSVETGGKANVGTLCVIDQKPRTLDEAQKDRLLYYAQQIRLEIMRREDNE